MSTYLLLRNNKQTGPFILDELKKMSLKAYDLIWVEGKSAAWRYPGEIAELISFAPPVPEQPYDRFYKKVNPETTLNEEKPALNEVKPAFNESRPALNEAKPARNELQPVLNEGKPAAYKAVVNPKRESRESVYINLPAAEKKHSGYAAVLPAHEPIDLDWDEPRAPGLVKIPSAKEKAKRKWLLTGSVTVFFVAGMLTGFYLSNRRNFYSTVGNTPQSGRQTESHKQAAPEQNAFLSGRDENKIREPQKSGGLPEENIRAVSKSRKKQIVVSPEKKDSIHTSSPAMIADNHVADSVRSQQEAASKLHILAARVIAHPEEYLLISTGNFKTGLLGGISEAPVSVTNRSGVSMDLVVVAIDYIQHNKKIFKTENLSFHNLAPGATVTAEAPKSPRGVKIAYRLTVANSQQIGMAYSRLK